MLIVGTGGLGTDMLNALSREFKEEELVFYNDTSIPDPDFLTKLFRVIKNEKEAESYFRSEDNRFIVAVGDNHQRKKLTDKFLEHGGTNPSFISKYSDYGKSTQIAPNGVIIMHGAGFSWDTHVDEGTVIYSGCSLGHGTRIGKYCFLSANVIMSNTVIGDFCSLNIGVKFKPGLMLGANSFVGIGSVVNRSFPENSVIRGYPAR